MKRLVACVRWHCAPWDPARYFPVAEKISALVAAAGGRRVTWGADRYSFEFDPDDFDAVGHLALRVVADFANHSVGIAARELVFKKTSSGALCPCGLGLALAEALAGAAGPGRVLVDPEIDCSARGFASISETQVEVRELSLRAATLIPGVSSIDEFFDAPLLPLPVQGTPPPPSNVMRGPSQPAPPRRSASQPPPPNGASRPSVRPSIGVARVPHPPRPGSTPPVLVRPPSAPPPLKRSSLTPPLPSVRLSSPPPPPSTSVQSGPSTAREAAPENVEDLSDALTTAE